MFIIYSFIYVFIYLFICCVVELNLFIFGIYALTYFDVCIYTDF